MESVREISVGRLHHRRRKHQQAAEDASLRQVEVQLVAEQRLEGAERRAVEIDEKMRQRKQDQAQKTGARRALAAWLRQLQFNRVCFGGHAGILYYSEG